MRTITRVRALLAVVVFLASSLAASAQAYVFEIDPQQSRVAFTLDDVLHTVRGTFQLKRGTIHFDGATGAASGEIVVDATTGDSGSRARDHKMHKEILQSDKYNEISFAPHNITGQLPQEGRSQVTMTGLMTLHGQAHEMSLLVPVQMHAGQAVADLSFVVPYVQWGLKNPSTFILRVSDKVKLDVHAVGRLEVAAAAHP
jgi:polyisoprenoid-binding protein YceI